MHSPILAFPFSDHQTCVAQAGVAFFVRSFGYALFVYIKIIKGEQEMETMFSNMSQKKIPFNIKECMQTDPVSANLWTWCERLEKLGKILFWILIVRGLYNAIDSAITTTEVTHGTFYPYTETETTFDFMVFLTSAIATGIYAFLEYCGYHVIALLIGALASITQSNVITANVALLSNVQSSHPDSSEKENSPISDRWQCEYCDEYNEKYLLYCKGCGKYRFPSRPT